MFSLEIARRFYQDALDAYSMCVPRNVHIKALPTKHADNTVVKASVGGVFHILALHFRLKRGRVAIAAAVRCAWRAATQRTDCQPQVVDEISLLLPTPLH
jgi:hypothetical protein